VGDVEVKSRLAVALNRYLAPMRERMAIDEGRPGLVETILAEGVERVRAIAEATMSDVHDAMGLDFKPRPKRHTLGDGRPRRSTT
jgi:tryptophanyl-tRNA synthetase